MNSYFSYLLELNISVTIFFLIYLLLYRKDANFGSRRIYLLLLTIVSMIVPVLRIQLEQPVEALNAMAITLHEVMVTGTGSVQENVSLSFSQITLVIYLVVTMVFALKLISGILRIIIQAFKSNQHYIHGHRVLVNSDLHASSFFNLIFIDPSKVSGSDLTRVLEHESSHARFYHSVDRVMSEILLIISWFNPVLWLLRREIVVNHEYQADNRVIEHGTDNISYQLTILNQYIGNATLANQFSNQIKNRINMLNKNYKKGSLLKNMIVIPVSALLLLMMACNTDTPIDEVFADQQIPAEEEIFYVVEEMPQWPDGGDMIQETRKFIAKNLAYPDLAKESGAEGKVFVKFLVTKTGKVIIPDPSMLPPELADEGMEKGKENEVVVISYRPLDEIAALPEEEVIQLFKDECVRVFELMPNLVPGKQRGQAVNVIFTMPIIFKQQ